MSTIRTPVGPQPPKVYWRRRLLVLLGVLVVILIIILIIVRPGGTPKAVATHTPKPTTTTAATVTACKADALDVEAVTDALSYAAGVNPKLSLTLTNNGAAPCTFDVGTDKQIYTITSGSENIWTSTDCQTNPTPTTMTLEPGKQLTTDPITWDRTRSDPATCKSTTRPKVIANGASYHLGVSIGGVASKKTAQFILK